MREPGRPPVPFCASMDIDLYIYYALLLVSCMYGFIFIRRIPAAFRYLVLALCLTFITEVVSRVLTYTINNSCPPYHFYTALHFVCMSAVYAGIAEGRGFVFYFQRYASVFILCFSLLNTLFFQDLYTFPSNTILLASVCIMLLTLQSFASMLRNPSQLPLWSQKLFWFNTGNLVMNSFSFVYWGLFNLMLIADEEFLLLMLELISALSILTYIMYAVSIYLAALPAKTQN